MALERTQQGFITQDVWNLVRTRERLKATSSWRFSESTEETGMLANHQHTNQKKEDKSQWFYQRAPWFYLYLPYPLGPVRDGALSFFAFFLSLFKFIFRSLLHFKGNFTRHEGFVKKEVQSYAWSLWSVGNEGSCHSDCSVLYSSFQSNRKSICILLTFWSLFST